MAIRMTDDPQDQNQEDYNDDRGGGGRPSFPGGGNLIAFLPLLLSLFKGKRIFLLLIIGAAVWFFMGRGGGCNILNSASQLFSQSGYNFEPAQYDKAAVYEGLADDNTKNPLPEAVSLLRFAPRRGQQGQQGSCVAWSSAYAAHTILHAASAGADPNQTCFSPSFLYNQIGLEGCQGSYIQYAMEFMSQKGSLPLSQFAYSDQECSRNPNSSQYQEAAQYKIHGFTRLTEGNNVNSINLRAVKEHLAKDAPVVIGMMVGQSFMQNMMGKELWQPQGMDVSQIGMGGHAMCVIGYDDRKFGGAFQIMNSWGPEWGNNGIGWVRYGDFKDYVREAYGIDPLPKQGAVARIPLECNIGLVNNADNKYIQLKPASNNLYKTISPIKAGTRFKVEVKNATECYIYIFGQEANGTSYVLFPYLKPGETASKHSPYCGITGYRLFPRGQSLEADNVGNKDYIAIVAGKEPLNYQQINTAISASAQSTFESKVNDALKSVAPNLQGITYGSAPGGAIHFKAASDAAKVVATIVAFDKTN